MKKNKSKVGNKYVAEFSYHNYTNHLNGVNGFFDDSVSASTFFALIFKILKVQRKHHYPIIDIRYRNFKNGSEKPKPDKANFICQRRI